MRKILSYCFIFISILLLTACSGSGTVARTDLSSLSIVDGNLDQVYQASQLSYTANVGYLARSVKISAVANDSTSTVSVNGIDIGSDNISQSIPVAEGTTEEISVVVKAVTGDSRAYKVTVSRASAASFAEEAYIKASKTTANDWFGYTVALSGDTLAVGAYFEDSKTTGINSTPVTDGSADSSGAVYVFTRSGSTWTQQAYIKASNTGANDRFGISIALDGDTLAVGAFGEASSTTGINSTPNDAATNAGAVYVFSREGTTWTQQAYIKASNAEAGDFFGDSVALHGDTLAVGADLEDSSTTGINSIPNESATAAGAVYVFTRSGTTWTQQAYIKASHTTAYDWFGDFVALYGDTLAVGAMLEDSNTGGINPAANDLGTNSGAVFIFVRSGTTWTQQAFIKAAAVNAGDNDYFGNTVALSAETLAVGAYLEDSNTSGINTTPNDDGNADNSGAAYIFTRSGTTWTQQAYIKASNTDASDEFGRTIALDGDSLAVGAKAEDSSSKGINSTPDNSANAAGAVYVFTRTGTTWIEKVYVKASNTEADDYFSGDEGIALSGDTLAVGAFGEDSITTGINSTPNDTGAANGSGAVYVFE